MKAKFKFWTGTEMLTEGFFINADGTVWAWVDYRCTNSFVLKGDLIQYTGLKDKNGKEIYEGDIVKCCRYIDSYSVSVVTYQRAMFRVIENAIGSTYLGQNGEDILEIIGNIYETPELLNQNIKL